MALGTVPTKEEAEEHIHTMQSRILEEEPIDSISANAVHVLADSKMGEGAILTVGAGEQLKLPRIAAREALLGCYQLEKAPKGVWLPHNYGVIVSRADTEQGTALLKKMGSKLKEFVCESDRIVFDPTIKSLVD